MKLLLNIFLLLVFSNLAQAAVKTENIEYKDGEQSFTGYLTYDDSIKGKRPGVLVVHEWWGLSDYEKLRARMLAELGYVAFVVDMYGSGKLTDNPDQAKAWMQEVTTDVEWWRERAQLGVNILKNHKLVEADNIAAIGYCFGGGTVLQMAYDSADLKGVVSFHGSLPIADKESFGKIKPRILVLHGNADGFVPRDIVNKFQLTLDEADARWEMITYGKVKHSFTNPKADTRGIPALKYDKYADENSWNAMQTFLKMIFK
jgi:dienelactone hydrolase